MIFLGVFCVISGPVGWLLSRSYESRDRARAKRMHESTAATSTRNVAARQEERNRKAAQEGAAVKRDEREIWDAAYERSKDVEAAHAAVLVVRNLKPRESEARDRRAAELRASYLAKQAEVAEARRKSKVL